MDVLSETVRLIQDRAVVASGARDKCVILAIPGMPAHQVMLVGVAGNHETVTLDPQPRKHTLASLSETVEFIDEKCTEKSVVWFDTNAVVVILDDDTRRDIATLSLNLTPVVELLKKIEADKERYDQRDFRRLLKVDLAGSRKDDKLLNWVSGARFNTSNTTGGSIAATKESLGRDINDAAVSAAGEFPEEIGLDVRVFDDASLKETWGIKCTCELFLREAEFTITPYPLEIHNAIESEVDVMGAKLREAVKVPVFRGRP